MILCQTFLLFKFSNQKSIPNPAKMVRQNEVMTKILLGTLVEITGRFREIKNVVVGSL